MKVRFSKQVGAALVVSLSLWMLGGCVAESADDEDEPVGETAAAVTLEPTPKVLSNEHPGPPAPLTPVLPAAGNTHGGEPEPNPWDVGDESENRGAANGATPPR